MLGTLKPIAPSELELMRSWRNAPAVRKNMYTTHEISAEEHMSWWSRIKDRKDCEYFMYYLHPGQACALSMVCATRQETSQVMARAVKETEVLVVPLRYMDEWMTKYKSWYHFVLESYRSRFEELLVTLDHVAFRAMDERLEFYIREHRRALQSDMLEINHQEIADELNSSREVISRLLKKMEQQGKLKLHRNAIEITGL